MKKRVKKELDMEAQYAHIKSGGVHLYVKHDGKIIGTLSATNTNVKWYPKNAKNPIMDLTWEKFDVEVKKWKDENMK